MEMVCEHEDDDGMLIEYETDEVSFGGFGVVRWACAHGDFHECLVSEL